MQVSIGRLRRRSALGLLSVVSRVDGFLLCAGETVPLQDVVGKRVAEDNGADLIKPRTVKCRRSQLRQRAWMHSQIERGLYCALPASLAIRARQANTPAPSPRRGR